MNGPESVNIVFLEQDGKPEHVSAKGYGVAPQVIATTPDNLAEKAFFERVLGLDETSYHRFSGPEVERTIGLPPGGALDVRIFGDVAFDYGRLEIVQYEGVLFAGRASGARVLVCDIFRQRCGRCTSQGCFTTAVSRDSRHAQGTE
jgi:hypothetical protein